MKRYKIIRDESGPEPRYRVDGIELFEPHAYPGSKLTGEPATIYTEADVDRMVAQAKAAVKSFIGHNYPGSSEEKPVRGSVTNVRKEVNEKGKPVVVGDLVEADPILALGIARRHYQHVSVEFNPKTLEMSGVAWLGSRSPHFKHFTPIRPDVDRGFLGTIKADAKEFAVREGIDSIPVALREDVADEGTVDTGGAEGGNEGDVKALIERLTGLVTNLAAEVGEVRAKQAQGDEWMKLLKKGSVNPKAKAKEPVGAREDADEADTEADEETAALRETVAKLNADLDAMKDNGVRTALRADLTALKAKFAISDDTASAIVDVCAPIKDEKARKAKFAALTKGFREAPLEDSAPEGNTEAAKDDKIADEKVAKMLREATDPADRKVISQSWKDLVEMRKNTPKDSWGAFFIDNAENYVRSQVYYHTSLRAD